MSSYHPQSAIDDSFETINFAKVAEQHVGAEDEEEQHGWPPPGYYSGPRSGHWTVNSDCRSAIDDRCPTEWIVAPASTVGGQPAQPNLTSGLLRKLADSKPERNEAEQAGFTGGSPVSAHASKSFKHSAHSETRPQYQGFYLPTYNNALYTEKHSAVQAERNKESSKVHPKHQEKPVSPGAKDRQQREAVPKQKHKQQPNLKKQFPKSPPTKAHPPVIESQGKSSVASVVSALGSKKIRIVSKSGDEVVVEIPDLKSASRKSASVRAGDGDKIWSSKDKAENGRHASPPLSRRGPTSPHALTQSARGEQGERSSSSRKTASPVKSHSPAAETMQWHQADPDVFPPRSAQAVSLESLKSAVRSTMENEARLKGEGRDINSSQTSRRDSVARSSKAPSAITKATSLVHDRPYSFRSLQATVKTISENSDRLMENQHSGMQFVSERLYVSAGSHQSRTEPKKTSIQNSSRPTMTLPNRQQPPKSATIFAGRGWISPHPLSVASSDMGSPPQSAIQLPEGGKFTYEDWRAVQADDVPYRFSRSTNSVATPVIKVPCSTRNGSHSTGMRSHGRDASNHASRIDSHRSSRHSSYHSASTKKGDCHPSDGDSKGPVLNENPRDDRGWAMETQCDEAPSGNWHSGIASDSRPDKRGAAYSVISPDGREQIQLTMPWDHAGEGTRGNNSRSRPPPPGW
ncbi:Ribokinase-like protein [Acrodontium crateriforme]|uniref:Ribokinase-like protein n=1 Tax=Acrodontium crateriforme TaxID=150365 RepID=A0AAQ3M948_9PEZI|nr:Ribokinase-like protein [Acrodontium crateriforme]